ncbi:MAG: helix-turn-helix domain-containing protein [Janthinobacterium lividum]
MVTRIRQLLEWQQLSPTQFADLIGVGRPVISHILSERNKPSLEVVQRISEALPAVSLLWLLKGTGSMMTVGPVGSAAEPAEESAVPAQRPVLISDAAAAATLPPPVVPAVSFSAPARQETKEPRAVKDRPARFVKATAVVAPASPTPISPSLTATPAVTSPALATPPVPPVNTAMPAATEDAVVAAPPVERRSEVPVVPETELPASGMPPVAAAAAMFGEPGKAIRRIVIFYRDGSFADYQPEG